jgi:hypothetical protein
LRLAAIRRGGLASPPRGAAVLANQEAHRAVGSCCRAAGPEGFFPGVLMQREYCRAGRSEGGTGPNRDERIMKPAIVPICTRTAAILMQHRKCADVLEVGNGSWLCENVVHKARVISCLYGDARQHDRCTSDNRRPCRCRASWRRPPQAPFHRPHPRMGRPITLQLGHGIG